MDKKELRTHIKELNKQYLNQEYRQQASQLICTKLANLPQFIKAKRVGLFHALPDEPSLTQLLQNHVCDKELYLPRVEGSDIAFYRYYSENDLAQGSYGIAEPEQDKQEVLSPELLDVIIVPGMAFTKDGVRLGRGKAYYDRFLPKTSAFLVGTTFAFRLFPSLPYDKWDHLMNLVITN